MSTHTSLLVTLALVVGSVLGSPRLAAAEWVDLAPGIVGRADRAEFFAAGPDGRVMRVVTRNGAVAAFGGERGYPLAVTDDKLLLLGLPGQHGEARLILLDAESGAVITRLTVVLPPEVSALPLPAPKSTFRARASGDSAALRVDWTFEKHPLRGAVVHDAEGQGSQMEHESVVRSGAFVLGLGEASMTARFVRADEPAQPVPGIDLGAAERLAGIDGPQFRAADDASVLISSATPDAALGTVYRWELHDRGNGERLGELTVPYSQAPFVVSDEVVVYRIDPVMRLRSDGSREEHGARLIAFDLVEGRERWSIPVAEREWFGPLPP
jgi:hypothetical protein